MKKVPSNEVNRAARALLSLLALSVLFISPWANFDAINIPKIALLQLGLAIIYWRFFRVFRTRIESFQLNLLIIGIVLASISTTVLDDQSFLDAVVGNYGRFFGIATLFILISIFYASLKFNSINSILNLSKVSFFTSSILQLYLIFQFLGFDIVSWNNVYSSPSGTLGNPNFVSAYISFALIMSFPFLKSLKTYIKKILISVFFTITSITNLFLSNSTQGLLSVIIGITLLGLLYLRKYPMRYFCPLLAITIVMSTLSFLGVIGHGPFSVFLYSYTIGIRIAYWKYGLEMLQGHWLVGLGFDSYDDFYRSVMNADSVFSNSPHNFIFDLLVAGGFLLAIPILLLILWGPTHYFKRIVFNRSLIERRFDYDFLFVSFIILFLQCLINPFQISLVVWLFLCSGFLFSCYLELKNTGEVKKLPFVRRKVIFIGRYLLITLNFLGLIAVIFVLFLDLTVRNSISSRELNGIVKISEMPVSDYALIGVKILVENRYNKEANSAVKQIVAENPNKVEALWILSNTSQSQIEKDWATSQLRKLDPLGKISSPQG